MRYEFTNAAGQSCCKSDNIKHLCDRCAARAIKQHEAEGMRRVIVGMSATTDVTNRVTSVGVPEPPSLAAAIRASRGLPTVDDGSPAVDLVAAIQAAKARKGGRR